MMRQRAGDGRVLDVGCAPDGPEVDEGGGLAYHESRPLFPDLSWSPTIIARTGRASPQKKPRLLGELSARGFRPWNNARNHERARCVQLLLVVHNGCRGCGGRVLCNVVPRCPPAAIATASPSKRAVNARLVTCALRTVFRPSWLHAAEKPIAEQPRVWLGAGQSHLVSNGGQAADGSAEDSGIKLRFGIACTYCRGSAASRRC